MWQFSSFVKLLAHVPGFYLASFHVQSGDHLHHGLLALLCFSTLKYGQLQLTDAHFY